LEEAFCRLLRFPPRFLVNRSPASLPSSHEDRALENKVVLPTLLGGYVTHIVAKGGIDSLHDEVGCSQQGASGFGFPVLLGFARLVISEAIDSIQPPIPFSAVVRRKDLQSSPGYPYCVIYSTYEDLLDALDLDREKAYEIMASWLQIVETAVLDGVELENVCYVFSKRDGYSEKKLRSSSFRSIASAPLFPSFLFDRWFGNFDSMFKENHPLAYVIDVPQQYKKLDLHRKNFSIGLDFSRFDKTEPSDLLRAVFVAAAEFTQVPPKLAGFLEESVASSVLLMPDGVVYLNGGTMASGHRGTSLFNTMAAIIINRMSYISLGVSYWTDCVTTNCGDDGIHSFSSSALVSSVVPRIKDCMYELFSVVAKIDMRFGEAFPPGVLPPFLSRVEQIISSSSRFFDVVLVPVTPMRQLRAIQCRVPGQTDIKFVEQIQGVLLSLSAFVYLSRFVPGFPIPTCISALWELAEDYGVELPSSSLSRRLAVRRITKYNYTYTGAASKSRVL